MSDLKLQPNALRSAFAAFPTGVVAICGLDSDNSSPVGMSVNSFTSVSLDPPLVAVCTAKTSRTWPKLREIGEVGISVLGSSQEFTSRQLAAREGDRFADILWTSDGKRVFLEDAALWISATFSEEFHAGDHYIAIFEVLGLEKFHERQPLIFHNSKYWQIENS